MMFGKMRWRIAVPYIVLILITMIGLMFYVSTSLKQRYLTALENQLIAQASQISTVIPRISPSLDPLVVNDISGEWAEDLNSRVTIIDANGVVIGESNEDYTEMENHLNRPEVQQALNHSYGSSTRFSRTVGYRMMYVAVPIISDGKIEGFARVALSIDQVEESIRNLQQGLFIVTIIVLVIAFLIAVVIADITSRPLRNLIQTSVDLSREIGIENEISDRLRASKRGEIDQLTSIINSIITNIHHQMERVRSESIKLNEILDQMTDGVIIADAHGSIQMINPAASRMFEIHSEEAVSHSIAEVIRHHQLIELWRRCQDSDQIQSVSMEIGLDKLYINGIATPLGKGLPGGILFLFQDLTYVKKLEIVRRDFVSNISHELRTPLASLKALTETLMDRALQDPPEAHKFITQIDVEVESLTLIVEELLELSRIETGKLPLRLETIQPILLIDKVVERLNLQIHRANLDIGIECPASLPSILVDRARVERVIVNLLHNAIKFTPEGGKITVSAQNYRDNEEQFVLFAVQDTGVGISETDLPRIFERFYKSDRARSSGGSGLGLSIAQHIVLIHGGRIWAESLEGQGSTFYFTLPVSSN